MSYVRLFVKAALSPFIMLVVVFSLYLLWTHFGMPQDDVMVGRVRALFDTYGLSVALISSFLEVLLLVGWYFPGSVVIFLSVLVADSWTQVLAAVVVVTIGMQAGYTLNYVIGKYGWYKLLLRFGLRTSIEETQKKMERYGMRFLLFSYWHPGLGSVSATVAGILQYPTKTFFLTALWCVLFWNVVWGLIVYSVGERSLELFFSWPFILGILCAWTAVRFIGLVREAKKVSI